MNDAWRSIARLGLDGKHCVDWCRSPIARLAAQYNCFLHSLFSKSFEGKHPILQRNLLANERKAHRYHISVRSVTFCIIVTTNSPYQHIITISTPPPLITVSNVIGGNTWNKKNAFVDHPLFGMFQIFSNAFSKIPHCENILTSKDRGRRSWQTLKSPFTLYKRIPKNPGILFSKIPGFWSTENPGIPLGPAAD